MQVSIRSNIKDVLRDFQDVKQQHVPMALVLAINDTLFELRQEYPKQMQAVFDKPVPFTTNPNAWQITKATRSTATGVIKLKELQASYLQWQVYGGVRSPKKRAIAIPQASGGLMAWHGGLKRDWKKALSNKKKYFSGVPKGMPNATPGIYQRLGVTKKRPSGQRIRLEVAWEKSASYSKRWDVYESSYNYVRVHFEANFRKRLQASRLYQQTH